MGAVLVQPNLSTGVVPDCATIEQYMEIVQRKWILRQLCLLVDSISSQARGAGVDALSLLSDSRRSLGELHATAVQTTMTERLRGLRVDPASLIAELDRFFAQRAFLPEGGSLLLALWAMNTWVFDAFDTTPYLLLESAVPQCGKTTVLQLLAALCRDAMPTSLMTLLVQQLQDRAMTTKYLAKPFLRENPVLRRRISEPKRAVRLLGPCKARTIR